MLAGFHPLAAEELNEAIAWYEQESFDCADKFYSGFSLTLERCLMWPESGQIYPEHDSKRIVRSSRIPHSQYRIIYTVSDDTLWVLAVAHVRRRPGYWSKREVTI